MSIFDNLNNGTAPQAEAAKPTGTQTITFNALPESAAELMATPEGALDSPYKAAALTVCALCAYAAAPEIGIEMLNALKGPQPLSEYEKQFLRDRFSDKKYVPFSYFAGARPDNDYTPGRPFSVTIESDPYSYQNEGYCKLYLRSGGADSPRAVTLRSKGSKWYLWEQFLCADIRVPKSQDPWS